MIMDLFRLLKFSLSTSTPILTILTIFNMVSVLVSAMTVIIWVTSLRISEIALIFIGWFLIACFILTVLLMELQLLLIDKMHWIVFALCHKRHSFSFIFAPSNMKNKFILFKGMCWIEWTCRHLLFIWMSLKIWHFLKSKL